MNATIKINCDNAAFHGDDAQLAGNLNACGYELARILNRLAANIKEEFGGESYRLTDSNGNHVGDFKITSK